MKTTTVLTLEIPPELRERLNRALERFSDLTPPEAAELALREWLDRVETSQASVERPDNE